MLNYRKSLRRGAISALILSVISGFQSVVSILEGRIVSYFFLFYFILGFLVGILLLTDLISNQTRSMIVQVHRVNYDRLKVIKPNGKKRSLRIVLSEMGRYKLGDELELILTKRTRQVLEVRLHRREEETEA